jgi:2-methylisocitrate lyase-like PEP mutase family enzyme
MQLGEGLSLQGDAGTESMSSQANKAEAFRKLHDRKKVLILPNAWDVPSARVFEDSGFPAVATSSAGMMVSLGYPDGEEIPKEEFVSAVRRITRVLSVPLTVDVVGGFGEGPEDVAKTVKSIIETGAVGINIEDFVHATKKLHSVEDQVEKLRELVRLKKSMGVPFVINARTDALRYAAGDDAAKFDEAVRRGIAFRDAGVDCVYPMGLTEGALISKFVAALDFPVNVMVRKGLPTVPELQRLGVARVSFGPSASYAVMGFLRRASKEVLEEGTYSTLVDGAITFDELNALAVPKKS